MTRGLAPRRLVPRPARLGQGARHGAAAALRRTSSPRRARSPASIVPPRSVASLRHSGRPRPVPLTRACSGLRTWVNSSKMRSWSSRAMPMPVSATENVTALPSSASAARDADLAALGELERVGDEVAQDLRDLAFVGVHRGQLGASSKRSATVSLTSSGRSMPRSALNSSATSNSTGRTSILPASILARSSRSLTSSARSVAALRMKPTCISCSAVSGPSLRASSRPVRRADRVQRRAELVAHVGEEARFISSARRRKSALSSSSAYSATTPRLVSSSSRFERDQLLLALAQLVQRAQQLAVLLLHLVERRRGGLRGERLRRCAPTSEAA